MKRCVIIGAAKIKNYTKIKSLLKSDDFFIFCDGGLNHQEKLGITPDLIIGDFDSHEKPITNTEIIELPVRKDDTDSFYAAKTGVARGFSEFLLLGTLGGRFDHSIGNISILLYLDSLGKHGVMADDYSEMEFISEKTVYISDTFSYFSLLNMDGSNAEVSIRNAEFPLDKGKISCKFQYGISNKVSKGKEAEITVKNGRLLIVKIW